MSAEMAAEMVDDVRVLLCEAPLVEGAVAAAARARTGASLEEVAGEARAALGMKAAQLGVEEASEAAAAPMSTAAPSSASRSRTARPPRPPGGPLRRDREPVRRRRHGGRQDHRPRPGRRAQPQRADHARRPAGRHDPGPGERPAGLRGARRPARARGRRLRRRRRRRRSGRAPRAAAPARVATRHRRRRAARRARRRRHRHRPRPQTPRGVRPPYSPRTPRGSDPLTPEEEWARLEGARAAAREDIEAARERIAKQAGEAEAGIFDAHLLLLDDAALLDPAREAIEGGASAAEAWGEAARETAEAYRGLDDPYLRERAVDVEDVGGRVLRHLTGAAAPGAIAAPGVLVVRDLTPGDAAALDRELVQGLAVARGGATSHAAILARALGIPSVVGLGDRRRSGRRHAAGARRRRRHGRGRPAGGHAGRARAGARGRRAPPRAGPGTCDRAGAQRDGETIEVAANVGSVADAVSAVELGADGVGLLRTEFLFLDRERRPPRTSRSRSTRRSRPRSRGVQ